jgi:hypothetical protein
VSDITPGEWFAYSRQGYTRLFVGSPTHDICEMNYAGDEEVEAANAALIAAAPALLAALVVCRDLLAEWVDAGSLHDDDLQAVVRANAAIKQTERRVR